ncbi:hypothetical protein HDV04_000489 [Boothiomyces sp. JEL0838]|nr:hypothetical protein HDV04_000489 [Boothiomyces sp. JEL0838]
MSLIRDVSPMCNAYLYNGFPNPKYPDGFQHICKDNSSGGEYFTYYAKNMDGHSFQHQEQFRIQSLFPYFYYGLIEPSGYWQFQEETRFNPGDFSDGGISKTHEFALRHPNGAWQHEYAWRNISTDYLFYCYAQSDIDENGAYRNGTYFCNLPDSQISGDYSPVPLKDPKFKDVPVRDSGDIPQTVPGTTMTIGTKTTLQTPDTLTMVPTLTKSFLTTTTPFSTTLTLLQSGIGTNSATSLPTVSINQPSTQPAVTNQTSVYLSRTKSATALVPKQGVYSSSKKLFQISLVLLIPLLI